MFKNNQKLEIDNKLSSVVFATSSEKALERTLCADGIFHHLSEPLVVRFQPGLRVI